MFPGFLCDVSAVSQGCLRGVSSVFQVYFNVFLNFKCISNVFKTVTRVSQKSVSRECLKGFSRMTQGCFKDYSRFFLFRMKGVPSLMQYLESIMDLYRLFYKIVALLFLQFLGKLNHNFNFGSESSLTNSESQSLNKKSERS